MADGSHIEWTDATWNIITGCSVVSPGCTNCYAMRLAGTRLSHHPSRTGLTQDTKAGPVWTGKVRFNEQWLDQPLRWKQPRRIFTCAHGDLFAEGVPDEWIDRVFAVMALAPQHIFQVLTKRAERMRDYLSKPTCVAHVYDWAESISKELNGHRSVGAGIWPLTNVWTGVSVEDQARADERIPLLLDTPAAKRFISAEPLLDAVHIAPWLRHMVVRPAEALTDRMVEEGWSHPGGQGDHPGLDWVIVGGESGPNARPMHQTWARALRDQCKAAGVPFFFKQWGEHRLAHDIYTGPREALPLNFENAALFAKSNGWRGVSIILSGESYLRVGKKAAGRLLDGREWSEFPDA